MNELHDRTKLLARLVEPMTGFAIEIDDRAEPFTCREVGGYRDALAAAYDPRAAMPQRLVLVGPDASGKAWLAEWAEDAERVHRTLTVRRIFDGRKVTTVATLASYGSGIDTQLGIGSVTAPTTAELAGRGGGVADDLSAPLQIPPALDFLVAASRRTARAFRSGIHARAALDAALAQRPS